ncbi:hypothetical protein D3C80_862850 [compost metagenome]
MRTCFRGGALIAKSRIGVRPVEIDALDIRAEGRFKPAFTSGQHRLQHFRLDHGVPGIVIFAGFQHGTGGRCSIATTLEGDRSKGGLGRIPVIRIGLEGDHVVRLEVGDDEGAGADRAEIGSGAAGRLGADAIGELLGLDDRRLRADKGGIGVGFRFGEGDLDGVRVYGFDVLDAFILCLLGAAAVRRRAVFPGEDHVFCSEGRAVRPFDVRLQLPGQAQQILGQAAVFQSRNFGCQISDQLSVFVGTGQRFDDHRRREDFFRAAGQERVHGGDGLPEQDLQVTIRAALGMCRGT